jgi:kynurenine aminotransferase
MFAAFLDPGNEVIVFEPYFDQYMASIIFNGGKPVFVPLHPPEVHGKSNASAWTIDFEELEYCLPPRLDCLHAHKWNYRRAITPQTKMLVLNTPHNPIGKVFTRKELEQIAALAIKYNFLVMSDEVVSCPEFESEELEQVYDVTL